MTNVDDAIQCTTNELFRLFRSEPGALVVHLPIQIYRDMLRGFTEFPNGYGIRVYGSRRTYTHRCRQDFPDSMGRRGHLYHQRHG